MPACRSDRGVRSVLEEIKDYFSVTCWVQPPNDDGVWEVREEVYFLRRAPREPLVTLRGTYGRLLLHLPAQPGAAWVEPPDPQLWPHSPRTPVAELCLLCVLRVIAAARPRTNGGSWLKEKDLHAELTNLLHLLSRRRVELQLVHRNCLAGASVPEGKTQLCVRHELRSKEHAEMG